MLVALGLWLFAAVVIGAATVYAARGSGAAAVTAIVVGEVYTLLIVALTIVFRPRTAQALGLVRCRGADVGLAFAACGGAYLMSAAIQSAGGPWPWSSSIAILKAMARIPRWTVASRRQPAGQPTGAGMQFWHRSAPAMLGPQPGSGRSRVLTLGAASASAASSCGPCREWLPCDSCRSVLRRQDLERPTNGHSGLPLLRSATIAS